MAVYNVELRKRTGSTYGDKVLVATHKTLVEGLLGVDGKILDNLLPTYVFGGLRYVDFLDPSNHPSTDSTTGDILTQLNTFITTNGGSRQSCYFIFNSDGSTEHTITVSTDHVVFYAASNDPGNAPGPSGAILAGNTFKMNPGDWLICNNAAGTEWAVINNTYAYATTVTPGLMSPGDKTRLDGLSNYSHPTDGANVDLTVDDDHKIASIKVNSYGHVTSISTEAIRTATTSLQGLMSAADKTKLDGIAQNANNYSLPIATSAILGGIKVGAGLTIAPATGLLSADSQTDNNFTTVLLNKLNGIETGANYYAPPTDGANKTLTLGGIERIAEITVAEDGRVTSVSKENIDSASISLPGVVKLATNAASQEGTNDSLAVTPAGLGSVLGFALGFPIFADLETANTAAEAGTFKDGSYAFVEV